MQFHEILILVRVHVAWPPAVAVDESACDCLLIITFSERKVLTITESARESLGTRLVNALPCTVEKKGNPLLPTEP